MTNAAVSVTKPVPPLPALGPRARVVLAQYAVWLAFDLIAALINAVSVAADHARGGSPILAWEPYVWELTSFLGFAFAALLLLAVDAEVGARGVRPAARLVGYAVFSFAFSALHIAVMIGSRPFIYMLFGPENRYRIGPWLDRFVYEYPKDLVPYLLILGMAFLWRRSLGRTSMTGAAEEAPGFLVRDAAGQRLIRADEIDWVEAQGNYVALHVGGRSHLARQTLREAEGRLAGAGFIRTHRSALVRRDRLRGVERDDAGGLVVVLDGEARVSLSQSRRSDVMSALAERV